MWHARFLFWVDLYSHKWQEYLKRALKHIENGFVVLAWSSGFKKGIICRGFDDMHTCICAICFHSLPLTNKLVKGRLTHRSPDRQTHGQTSLLREI